MKARAREFALWRLALLSVFIVVIGCNPVSGVQDQFAAKECKYTPDTSNQALAASKTRRHPGVAESKDRTKRADLVLATNDAELDSIILSELDRRRIPGGAVAVIKSGKIRYAKSFGLANVETKEPATLNTRFWIGSMGKQFTAMAVMMLVEQGRLALDEKVSTYLPHLPLPYDAVTVRHLLTHTSGMKRDFMRRSCPPFKTELLTGEVLFEALGAVGPEFEPGAAAAYSNTGYTILGMLIETVGGTTYHSFLTARIFGPLGMHATQSVGPGDLEIKELADGHDRQDGRYRVMRPALRFGGGTVISNIVDLAKWEAALYSRTLVSSTTYRRIWTPHLLNGGDVASLGHDDYGVQYKIGFGWFISDEPGNLIVHHGGGLDGNASYIDRYVDKDLTVIVLVNREPTSKARAITREVARHYGLWLSSEGSQ